MTFSVFRVKLSIMRKYLGGENVDQIRKRARDLATIGKRQHDKII